MTKLSDIFYVGGANAIAQPVVTGWEAFTPSNTQGFGTVTAVNMQYRRVGSSMEIRGYFTTGTTTGDEAQIELPNSLTVAGGAYATIVGVCGMSQALEQVNFPIATAGDTYLNISRHISGASATLLAVGGTSLVGAGVVFSVHAKVPIAEWSDTELVSTETNAELTARVQVATDTTSGAIPAYYDSGWLTSTALISAAAGALPSGTVTKLYRWVKTGNKVEVYLNFAGTISQSIGTFFWDFQGESVNIPTPAWPTSDDWHFNGWVSGAGSNGNDCKIYQPNGYAYCYLPVLQGTTQFSGKWEYYID